MKKLNHPPFNDWLLSNEILTPERDRLLQDHLRTCPECGQVNLALNEVRFMFRESGQVNPSNGFTDRWKVRFDLLQERNKKRNAWILFGVAGGTAVLFLAILVWRVFGLINSPIVILTSLVYMWTLSQVYLRNLGELLRISIRFIPTISVISFIFFTGFCSLVSVLWVVTYRKLTMNGRAIPW